MDIYISKNPEFFDKLGDARRLKEALASGAQYALSVSPLQAYFLANGICDIINRTCHTFFRGRLFVHATKKQNPIDFQKLYKFAASIDSNIVRDMPTLAELERDYAGGIVGSVELFDEFGNYASNYRNKPFTSYWHLEGFVGWRVRNAQKFAAKIPARGAIGFWQVEGATAAALGEMEKSVVKQNLTTQKAAATKSTCKDNLQVAEEEANPTIKQNLRVADAPKAKRIGKQAMRSTYAKIAKKLKGPTAKKEAK